MRYCKNVKQVVNDGVDDRMWKPPEYEMTDLTVKRRAQFGICQQQLDDALDLIPEPFTESRYLRFITCRIFNNFQLRLGMKLVVHPRSRDRRRSNTSGPGTPLTLPSTSSRYRRCDASSHAFSTSGSAGASSSAISERSNSRFSSPLNARISLWMSSIGRVISVPRIWHQHRFYRRGLLTANAKLRRTSLASVRLSTGLDEAASRRTTATSLDDGRENFSTVAA